MKKVLYLFAAAILTLACNNPDQPGGNSGKKETVFEVSPTSSKATALSQNLEFNVKSSKDWDAYMNLGIWAKIQMQDAASGKIVVNLSMNSTEFERTDTLVVNSDKKTIKVPISQQGIESLLSRTQVTLVGTQSQTIEVSSNTNWSAAPVNSGYGDDWLEISPAGGTAGTTTVTFKAKEENLNIGDRNMVIKFTMDSHVVLATVTQKQTDALLRDRDKVELSNGEQNFDIKIETNVDYTVSIDCDWIERVEDAPATKALNQKTETFKALANPDQTVREGTITFKGGDCTETVKVYQAECDVLAFVAESVTFPAEGGLAQVELRSNLEYEIIWPQEDWISKAAAPNAVCAIRSDVLYMDLKENFRMTPRWAEITVLDKNSEMSSTINVIQEGGNPAIKDTDVVGMYNADGTPILEYVKGSDQTSYFTDSKGNNSFRLLSPESGKYLELRGLPEKTEMGTLCNVELHHNMDLKPKNGTSLELIVVKAEKNKVWLITDEGLGFIIKK